MKKQGLRSQTKLLAVGVIPARLGSTRLPEKVLRDINGRPMIQHVWERAKRARALSEVLVACDDLRVLECVQSFGGKAVLTRKDHPNGTSRVAEIAAKNRAAIFVNIQGDEPMIHPRGIDALVSAMRADAQTKVATLGVRRNDRDDYLNPNVVKVICDRAGYALYFSRAPIPHDRSGAADAFDYVKHLGIYAYRRNFLLQFVRWPPGLLEKREQLEQLRILEAGYKIRIVETAYDSLSVDTASDLNAVEKALKKSMEQPEVVRNA